MDKKKVLQQSFLAFINMVILWTLANLILPNLSWNDLGLIKISQILWVLLAFIGIQVFGLWLRWLMGQKAGAILTGFLAGFVSSTALTISLVQKVKGQEVIRRPALKVSSLLAAQVAVLIEAVLLVSALNSQFLKWLIPLFLPVILVSLALIALIWKKRSLHSFEQQVEIKAIDYYGALQMSLLISGLLVTSQYLLQEYGEQSLLWAHFGLALFEVHGAFISAVQLQLSDKITLPWAVLLLAVSLSASFVSKFFIVLFMGSRDFLKGLSLAFGILLVVLWGSYGLLLYTFS